MGSWAGLRSGSEILHFENSHRHALVNELVPGKWYQFTAIRMTHLTNLLL